MPAHNPPPTGWDLSEPRPALNTFLGTLPAQPQLLALGEPTHGLNAFPAWRNRIFQTLVEEHGFRSIALESDIIAGLHVDAHLAGGETPLDHLMRAGFSHGFDAIPANRHLIEWMRAFNARREPSDHLRFYGFDAPLENLWAASPRHTLLALHAFLTAHLHHVPVDRATLELLSGDDAAWTNPAAGMDATQSIGGTSEAARLRGLADDLAGLLRTETPRLAPLPGFWEAELHARTATGLLRYHAIVADPDPTRVERMLALRDLMMADNLTAIATREHERGPTLVFAHNVHLQREAGTMRIPGLNDLRVEWWSAGAHLDTRLHHRYAFIASDLGTAPDRAVGTPAPDTLQGALMHLESPVTLAASRHLAASLPPHLERRSDVPARAAYFPLEARHLALADGLLFLRDTAN